MNFDKQTKVSVRGETEVHMNTSKQQYTTNYSVPALKPGEKYNLSVKEASAYFGIGEKKLRKIIDDSRNKDFVLMNGSHVLIKRIAFERFIDNACEI